MRFLILGRSVGRIEKKKKPEKKIISILGIGALVPQRNSCGARKTTRQEPKINMAEKLVKVVAKLRQRGEKEQPPKLLCYIKWFKNVVSFFFFFFFFWKCQKFGSVGRRETEKKKGDGLSPDNKSDPFIRIIISLLLIPNLGTQTVNSLLVFSSPILGFHSWSTAMFFNENKRIR